MTNTISQCHTSTSLYTFYTKWQSANTQFFIYSCCIKYQKTYTNISPRKHKKCSENTHTVETEKCYLIPQRNGLYYNLHNLEILKTWFKGGYSSFLILQWTAIWHQANYLSLCHCVHCKQTQDRSQANSNANSISALQVSLQRPNCNIKGKESFRECGLERYEVWENDDWEIKVQEPDEGLHKLLVRKNKHGQTHCNYNATNCYRIMLSASRQDKTKIWEQESW